MGTLDRQSRPRGEGFEQEATPREAVRQTDAGEQTRPRKGRDGNAPEAPKEL